MNAVRSLLRDLVERRLWPVALLLVIAAVAVPVYLGRSSSDEAQAPVPVPAPSTAGKASRAAVTLDEAPAESTGRGDVRNPFKQQHVPKVATPATGGGSGSEDKAPAQSGGSGGSTPSGTGGSDGADTTKPKADSATDPLDRYHLTLRVGKAGNLKTLKDVARLSGLPSAENPFFVFTGVLKDGKTAVFLLSSDAEATGDGKCRPSAKTCQTVEVKQGDTVFFDLKVGDEEVQYQLDIVRVYPKGESSAAAAATATERHSKAGAAMLRNAHVRGSSAYQGSGAYRWLPDKGVLVRAPEHSKARASANGAAAASAADVDATLPGLPVWHWRSGA
jgi:hypothetical protein